MEKKLKEKTNTSKTVTGAKQERGVNSEPISDREKVFRFLKSAAIDTKNVDLKYEILQILEIMKGKETESEKEMKKIIEGLVEENETLIEQKAMVVIERDHLKSLLDKNNN